jgi:Xaa-Pro aminopeptidase
MFELQKRREVYKQRYAKIQKVLGEKKIAGLLLTDPIQIRYATGTCMMPLWTAFNYCRYVLVLAEHQPVIWEYPEAQFVSRELWDDIRPCAYWQYRFSGQDATQQSKTWANHIFAVLKEKGVQDLPIGVDSLDFYGFQALQNLGIQLTDADEVMQEARKIKLPTEIEWLQKTVEITQVALKKFEDRIQPGVSENELLATFWESLLAQGGEWCYTRLIASGTRTNPWFQEAGFKKVQAGDLVGIDTDVIGLEGYACDISRTFLCGEKMTDQQREDYLYAREYIEAIREKIKPGVDGVTLAQTLPKVPEKYLKLRYPIFAHGLGMDDEPPFYPFLDQKTSAKTSACIEPNMVICIEFYAGQEGRGHGVKLEEQLLVTENGAENMSNYAFYDV